MLYDQLASRWPVLGSPLVVGNRVFATAGLLEMLDGVWAVAADAGTGRVIWERNDWSEAGTHGILSGTAQMCWSDDRIVFQGGQSPPIILDPEDGGCRPLFGRKAYGGLAVSASHMLNRGTMGQEVAALAPGVVLFGGRRLFTEDQEDGAWRNSLTFRVARPHAEPFYARMRPYGDKSDSNRMPAWDDRDVALVYPADRKQQRLALIPRDAFLDALEQSRTETATARWDVRGRRVAAQARSRRDRHVENGSVRIRMPVPGLCISDNAAVTLVEFDEERPGPEGPQRGRFWNVVAYAREGGEKMWEIDLPSVPLHDGLTVAADGRVVVALADGSVLCVAATGKFERCSVDGCNANTRKRTCT